LLLVFVALAVAVLLAIVAILAGCLIFRVAFRSLDDR
jgi:hypothetical protein